MHEARVCTRCMHVARVSIGSVVLLIIVDLMLAAVSVGHFYAGCLYTHILYICVCARRPAHALMCKIYNLWNTHTETCSEH